ncbi:MAG: hypothetical protein MNPFHGCM_02737 [Gemmatimonadaceae bacterium]|nr:hypothetical protein [Gemmatimonadaceae bacterium]
MRRIVILVLLLGCMQLILPLGTPGYGGQWLLILGFLIVGADAVGRLVAMVRLPKIVGYMLAGLIFGPSVLGTVSETAVEQLSRISSLAIAIIAFLAGAELRWSELRQHGTKILKILVSEMPLTFLVVTALLMAVRDSVPFLQGTPVSAALMLAMMFASVAAVHSPAVTIALLTETRAHGPVARTTLGVVLVADVAVILLFSAVLALARTVAPAFTGGGGGSSLGVLFWDMGGAVLVGATLGGIVAGYLRWVRRELFLFALIVAFFGAEIARLVHVETLLMLLTAGFVAENVSRREHGEGFRMAMERSAAPVFVVFFALAGASLHIEALVMVWTLVIPVVVVRLAAIFFGSRLGARWGKASPVERRHIWMGLVSQAGVAIGLATLVTQVLPERGEDMKTMLLAMIAVNEAMGPVFFRQALSRSGELNDDGGTSEAAPHATDETQIIEGAPAAEAAAG